MKTWIAILTMIGGALVSQAEITVTGANGSDGAFAPSEDVVIDLSLAAAGDWDSSPQVAGTGIYDAAKWAVVFKYSSVTIPEGVKVTFKNHPSHAPVVWLVNGAVSIDGEVSLDGVLSVNSAVEEAGPGGHRGSYKDVTDTVGENGFGPGGGAYDKPGTYTYGSLKILPLRGGSGGGRRNLGGSRRGSAGGGAILIASTDTVTVNGSVHAKEAEPDLYGERGSGGAIRIIADTLDGDGTFDATTGRIRLEANAYNGTLVTDPVTAVVVPDDPAEVWPDSNIPSARILSVNGTNTPADPHADVRASTTDMTIQTSDAVDVVIETKNMPVDSVVNLIITPIEGIRVTVQATHTEGNEGLSTWTATTTIPATNSILQVHATSQ